MTRRSIHWAWSSHYEKRVKTVMVNNSTCVIVKKQSQFILTVETEDHDIKRWTIHIGCSVHSRLNLYSIQLNKIVSVTFARYLVFCWSWYSVFPTNIRESDQHVWLIWVLVHVHRSVTHLLVLRTFYSFLLCLKSSYHDS